MPLVERRYAEALVDLYEENDKLGVLQENLEILVNEYKNQDGFKRFLLSPKVKMDTKKKVINETFKGRIEDHIVNLSLLLLDKGRIAALAGIYDECIKLTDAKESVLDMTITSAYELPEKHIQEIKAKYLKKYKAKDAKIELFVDEELIGGVKVQVGDKVTNASSREKLEKLRKLLVGSQ